MRVARLRPRARAREKGGRSKAISLWQPFCRAQSIASDWHSICRSQGVMHAQCHPPSGYRACSICLCVAITHLDFTHWQLRRALSNRRLPLQELRALAPPHPLLSVSSAAAAPLTDLPATQLLPPLPPPLLALCVRGRHHPAGRLMQLTSTDARLVSSSLIRPTTTDSEMPL